MNYSCVVKLFLLFVLILQSNGTVASVTAVSVPSGSGGRVEETGQSVFSGAAGVPACGGLSSEQRKRVDRILSEALARRQERVPSPDKAPPVRLAFPLQSSEGCQTHVTTAFVDHDASSGSVLDYDCGDRSYDTATYDHDGTDYWTYPFAWYKMENNIVEVIAAADGIVLDVEESEDDESCALSSTANANYVLIEHDDGSTALYAHFKTWSVTVSTGDAVVQGDILGIVGSSGSSTAPHLHLEVRDENNDLIDPYDGSCNPTISRSWWESQPEYYESDVIELHTSRGTPEASGCIDEENRDVARLFWRGAFIRFYAYYRDRLQYQVSTHRVYDPDGVLQRTWTFDSGDLSSCDSDGDGHCLTFWEYSDWTIPSDAISGLWTYQVEFEGRTCETTFRVIGIPSGILPFEVELPPGSVVREMLSNFDPSSLNLAGNSANGSGASVPTMWTLVASDIRETVPLPTASGSDESEAHGMSRLASSGDIQVAGHAVTSGLERSVLWTTGADDDWGFTYLPVTAGWSSRALASGPSGALLGWAAPPLGQPQATYWRRQANGSHVMESLPAGAGHATSIALGEIELPSGRWVYGNAGDTVDSPSPMIWHDQGTTWTPQALPLPAGATAGTAVAGLSDRLVGWVSWPDGATRSVIWTLRDGAWTSHVIRQEPGWGSSVATSVTSIGETTVAGGTVEYMGQPRAVLWFFNAAEAAPEVRADQLDVSAATGSPYVEVADVDKVVANDGSETLAILCYRQGQAGLPQSVVIRETRNVTPSGVWDLPAANSLPVLQPPVPNPFNPTTCIAFELPHSSRVRLTVHDVRGRRVASLIDQYLPPGHHTVKWNGRRDSGESVASGTYFYTLRGENWVRRGKMALIR